MSDGLRSALRKFSEDRKLNEAGEQRVNPQVKSIRLATVRAIQAVNSKILREDNLVTLAKFNAALTTLGAALTIVDTDFLRASRLLSEGRRLASISDEDDKGKT